MAKTGIIQRNNKRERLSKLYKTKRSDIKNSIYDKTISLEDRFSLVLKLSELPRNSAKNRIRNRCAITGRPRGYYRKVGLCRNMFRMLVGNGKLPGFVKSSL